MVTSRGGFPLALAPRAPGTLAQTWLYQGVRDAILRGQLRAGARLPSSRELARQCGVARGTVVHAFAQLAAEGYLASTVGSGTFVSPVLPDELLEVRARPPRAPGPTARRATSRYAARVTPFPIANRPVRAFRSNLPAVDAFPVAVWAQLASRRLRTALVSLLAGGDALGYRPLREAIADYLGAARGVACDADQVMIVGGIQEALYLVARLVIDPGDTACIEVPGYRGAHQVLQAAGARIVALAVDEDGMVLRRAALRRARLIYATPAHHYPLGVAMSLPRRLGLLDAIRGTSALVFEDDYDSEYRYAGRPLPALHGLDRAGQVVVAGSFSKVMFPALRLGYLVLPPDLVERFAAARTIMDRQLPLLEQAITCDFIVDGHLGRHLRRMRQLYADRLGVLVDAARAQLAGALELAPADAGMHVIGWLARGHDPERIVADARARDVEVSAVRWSAPSGERHGLELGFSAIAPRELRRGVEELAQLLDVGASRR
jgi:GntR family transcriptional regulator / MocR family aminotransferase